MQLRLVLCLSFVLALAACGSDEQKPAGESSEKPSAAAVPATPEYGGRIVEPLLGEPSNLIDVLATDSSSHEVADKIYVSPLRYDKNIVFEPYAAESFEILDEGKRIRITLKKNIRWFDGTPLTARDVEFTYKLMIDPKTPTAYSDDYKAISSFTVVDDYTFEVRYDTVFARALTTWAHHILPRHVLEGQDLLKTKYSREPMGAGPYKLAEWTPGSRLTLKANEDYFGGRPYLDEVIYTIIPDMSTQFLELKAGNVDMMGLTPKQYLFQTSGPDWDKNYQKFKYLAFAYSYLGYNLKNPLFSDKRVRRAITLAIDKEEIVKGVLFGLGVPAIGPYKPGTWVYNDQIVDYGYHPDQAKAMLAEAGWKDSDGDGVLDKDGRPFAFTILTNQGNEERIKTATIIQQRLKEVGIKIEVRSVEWAAFINEFINKGNFEATILGWNILQDPDIFPVWHSSQFPPQGLNNGFYANPEADRLIEEARRTLDQDTRKKLYDRFQEILHEDQPYCFLYVPYSLPIVASRIQGVEVAPAGIGWNFTKWWVPKSLQRTE
jgi:peptide/nickel transport system substrate-binding protein